LKVQEKLEPCPLGMESPISTKDLETLGGKILVTVLPMTSQGHVYVKKTGRFFCHSPADVPLQVNQRLSDAPRLSGLVKESGELEVYGMRRGKSGVHILMTLQVVKPPFPTFEVAYNSDLLHGYCNDHSLVDFFSEATGLH
jgi:hypothetical protein